MSARLVLVALAGLALVARAGGQTPAPPPPHTRDSVENVLIERNRSAMHPGTPLSISGNESEGNDPRARTPALANVEHRANAVDSRALYERALAAYGERELFHTAPVAETEAGDSDAGAAASGSAGEGVLPKGVSVWPIVAGATLCAFALAWYVARPRARRA